MFPSGLIGGGVFAPPAAPSGVSGMISAHPESRRRPSIDTSSPPIRPTTFMRLLCDMTSSRSGKTA